MRNFLIALFLSGCVKHYEVQSNIVPSQEKAEIVIQFSSTGSPCLDAMKANLSLAGCSEVSSDGDPTTPTGVKLNCSTFIPERANAWTNKTFLILMTNYVQSELEMETSRMVCMDTMFSIFQVE